MSGAVFALVGVLLGLLVGFFVWGRGDVQVQEEECIVFCPDGSKKTKKCKTGETGQCLADLEDECPGNV